MPSTLEAEIAPLVASLEKLAPRDSARVSIAQTQKPFGFTLTANREGFVRLAMELLEAASARGVEKPHSSEILLDTHLDYLACRSNQLAGFSTLQALVRDDEIDTPLPMPVGSASTTPPPRARRFEVGSRLVGAAFLLFALAAALGFFVVGLIVVQQLR